MSRETKAERRYRLIESLRAHGFTFEQVQALRRIEMTLRRWAELECGDSNDVASWAIERDEATDKPFMVRHIYGGRWLGMEGKTTRTAIADREKGALERLEKIITERNQGQESPVQFYHQTDPRGCALYIIRESDLRPGEDISAVYNRGIAVCD